MTHEPSSTWTYRTDGTLPHGTAAIRWPDGTVECHFRLRHPNGSLVAEPGDVGQVLTDTTIDCTRCSDACSA